MVGRQSRRETGDKGDKDRREPDAFRNGDVDYKWIRPRSIELG
jgi:hypothetical protein